MDIFDIAQALFKEGKPEEAKFRLMSHGWDNPNLYSEVVRISDYTVKINKVGVEQARERIARQLGENRRRLQYGRTDWFDHCRVHVYEGVLRRLEYVLSLELDDNNCTEMKKYSRRFTRDDM